MLLKQEHWKVGDFKLRPLLGFLGEEDHSKIKTITTNKINPYFYRSFPITSQLKLSKSAPFPKEKPMQKSTSSLMTSLDSSQICPKSHPIIAHDGKSLVLCKDCVQGLVLDCVLKIKKFIFKRKCYLNSKFTIFAPKNWRKIFSAQKNYFWTFQIFLDFSESSHNIEDFDFVNLNKSIKLFVSQIKFF